MMSQVNNEITIRKLARGNSMQEQTPTSPLTKK
jgi:hypothetical protein